MTTATVLRLPCKRRAICRSGMPSSWSRKIALRLSASIMEVLQALVKGSHSAQNGRQEQIGLRVKGPAFEPRILALADEALHVVVGELQIAEHRALARAVATSHLVGSRRGADKFGLIKQLEGKSLS